MIASFVHLRVRTAYSLSEGAIPIKDLASRCAKLSMPAVAITDSRNLFGAMEFSEYCAGAGVQPILGCSVGIRREEEGGMRGSALRAPDPDHVALLAQDARGWAALVHLVSRAHLRTPAGELPQIGLDELLAAGEGLLCLTGGIDGPFYRLLAAGQGAKARALADRLAAAFPGRLYLEIQRHGMEAEIAAEPGLLEIADATGLPLLATNDCHFLDEAMFEAHDALLCIADKTVLAEPKRRRLTPDHRFKSAEEMRALFADLPEAVENTLVVARRCAVMVEARKPILPRWPRDDGKSEAEALAELARAGLEERLSTQIFTEGMDDDARGQAAKPYRERLDYELSVIEKMGFPGYFLIVADFIQWAKARRIPVGPGRGSGAGSVVAWSLTITDLDPLRFNLLFERFLNPERVSMPDFDIDFCEDRRDEVIRYVTETYGAERVAQIITFGSFKARAVLRHVGRVLGMPLGYVDKICKLIPNNPANPVTLKQAIEGEPQLQRLRDDDPDVRKLLEIGGKLEGLYSHAGRHAAGVVIGDRRLDDLVPVSRDPVSDMPVTQYNMKYVEMAGLVKFDFLGLRTLTVLDHAVESLARRGIDLDLSTLRLDDAKTYSMLSQGDTTGVFQLESAGMRDVLRGLKPDRFEDIIAVVALYRPGPMDNIPSFVKRKHGEEKVSLPHPDLEPLLAETYGIMVYQEQVMQAAQVLAGYSLGGADLLRRAMGKKKKEEMDKQREVFCSGAEAKGTPRGKASEVFDLMEKFAGYGFNKSHAAAYALVAYHTAYLKANHPEDFMAAMMTSVMHDTDKLESFRNELRRLGVRLLPPDINRSGVEFTVETGPDGALAVRYALAAIRNVGEAAMEALVAERDANGAFRSLADFTDRIDARQVNRRILENLIRAGAFDGLEPNRARLLAGVETLLREAQSAQEDRETRQEGLFAGAGLRPAITLPSVPDWAPLEKLGHERDAIGFYLSSHPLDAYGKRLERLGALRSSDILGHLSAGGSGTIKLAGTVVSRKERISKSGNRYAFVAFSDATGDFEVTFFSETLAGNRELLDAGAPLLLAVDARLDGEQLRMTCQSVTPLEQAVSRADHLVKVFIERPDAVSNLRQVLSSDARGRGRLVAVARSSDQDVEVELPGRFALSPATLVALRRLPGVAEVEEF